MLAFARTGDVSLRILRRLGVLGVLRRVVGWGSSVWHKPGRTKNGMTKNVPRFPTHFLSADFWSFADQMLAIGLAMDFGLGSAGE